MRYLDENPHEVKNASYYRRQLEAATQRELELLAVIDEMSKLVIKVKLCRDEAVTQYPYLDQLYRMAEERRKK